MDPRPRDALGPHVQGARGGGEGASGHGGGGGAEGASGHGGGDGTISHGGGGEGEPAQNLEGDDVTAHLDWPPAPKHYDRDFVKGLIANESWAALETYIIFSVLRNEAEVASKFAPLMLLIRRAELSGTIATKGIEEATKYFKENVQPLVKCSSDYINGPAMKREIDEIGRQIETGKVTSSAHIDRDIDDFFKLYRPNISGSPDSPAKARSELWQFATRSYNETREGEKKVRPTYRCLACGRDFDVAISVMKDHLRSGGHQCAQCPKVTRNILKRLHVLYPDEVPMPEDAAPEQKVEMEGKQYSVPTELLKHIIQAQAHVHNLHSVFNKTGISDDERTEANRQFLEASTILSQCVVMAEAGGTVTSTSQTSNSGFQMPLKTDQALLPPAEHMHMQQAIGQTFPDLQNQGSLSFQNPAQSSGKSEFPYPGAQDSQTLQVPPTVRTQQPDFDPWCQHGCGSVWDCHRCCAFLAG